MQAVVNNLKPTILAMAIALGIAVHCQDASAEAIPESELILPVAASSSGEQV